MHSKSVQRLLLNFFYVLFGILIDIRINMLIFGEITRISHFKVSALNHESASKQL